MLPEQTTPRSRSTPNVEHNTHGSMLRLLYFTAAGVEPCKLQHPLGAVHFGGMNIARHIVETRACQKATQLPRKVWVLCSGRRHRVGSFDAFECHSHNRHGGRWCATAMPGSLPSQQHRVSHATPCVVFTSSTQRASKRTLPLQLKKNENSNHATAILAGSSAAQSTSQRELAYIPRSPLHS